MQAASIALLGVVRDAKLVDRLDRFFRCNCMSASRMTLASTCCASAFSELRTDASGEIVLQRTHATVNVRVDPLLNRLSK